MKIAVKETRIVGAGAYIPMGDGITHVEVPDGECGDVCNDPGRYQCVDGVLSEIQGWEAARAAQSLSATMAADARAIFEAESEAPVEALGITWNGGQDSAGYIQGAVSLAQALGEETVIITDIDDVAHELSFAEAMTVAVMVGKAFRTAFFKKQSGLVAAKLHNIKG